MDVVAHLVLSSVVWGPVLVILYWVIRLAVRHGMQDAQRQSRTDRAVAEVAETIRRQQTTYGGSDRE